MLYPPDERINVLAPIVRGRKGEFKRELAALRARGFTRARIDGQFVSLENDIAPRPPEEPHIDVLVDRLIVRAGVERRLADVDRPRAEAGRRHRRHQHAGWRGPAVLAANGLPVVRHQHSGDDARAPSRSTRRMAPARTARASAPSTTSIRRASCPTTPCRWRPAPSRPGRRATASRSTRCSHGLAARVRHRSARAVRQAAEEAARHHPASARRAARRGRARSPGRPRIRSARTSKGCIPNLRRRFDEGTWTDQETLEPYRALQPCPACDGARLRPESRAVRVKGRRLADFVDLPIADALPVVDAIHADGTRATDRRRASFARFANGCGSSSTSASAT